MEINIVENNIFREGYSTFSYIVKRIIDFLLVLILAIVTFPLVLYTIYRIRKESLGSIFFTQLRVGKNGKLFTCYKFRSMDESLEYFNYYTQDDDNRIYPYGFTMRKYRIDELPQLFNILKGDMHLIGPRAEWNELVEKYEKIIPFYHQRHIVKPGITGLAQVSFPYGRNFNDTKIKLAYDLEYIEKWSLFLEIKIIFKTINVIRKKTGV